MSSSKTAPRLAVVMVAMVISSPPFVAGEGDRDRPAEKGGAGRLVLVAGGGDASPGGAATGVKLDGPFGVDFDSAGNLYIVEISGHRVLRVDGKGILERIGGSGEKGYSGDGGPARKATFNGMHNLAITAADVMYIADTWNNCVRRIDLGSGIVTTAAGTGKKGFSGDGGPAVRAEVAGIYCVALDPEDRRLYLADLHNRRIRAVDLASGNITTIAGNGEKGVPADGAEARTSPLVDPRAVAADRESNVYILERGGHALRVVDGRGRIRTLIGDGETPAWSLKGPKHIGFDLEGRILIADERNARILRYTPGTGAIRRMAGTGKEGRGSVPGNPGQVALRRPHGVQVDRQGTLYIVDSGNDRVLKIEKAPRRP